jgi:hypothetical protein
LHAGCKERATIRRRTLAHGLHGACKERASPSECLAKR